MKKSFISLLSVAVLFSMVACHEPQPAVPPVIPVIPAPPTVVKAVTPIPPLPTGDRLRTKQIIEDREINGNSSQRISNFTYDASNQLINTTREGVKYVVYSYRADGTLATEKEFYASPSAEMYTKESLAETSYDYEDGRVKRQRNLKFMVANGLIRVNSPIRLLQKNFNYNAQKQIATEIDSVWATSEYRNDGGYVALPMPRFASVSRITYEYNDRGQVSRSTEQYEKDFYNDFGPVGTTTYSYEYYPNGLVSRKTVQVYDNRFTSFSLSVFTYAYEAY